MSDLQFDVCVIGAGVIGLACARRLAEKHSVLLVDSYPKFGQETSSRNSEVIHSGIYYPVDSKKTEWCIEGRERLYAFAGRYGVPHRKVGKIVVATEDSELAYLEKLSAHCRTLGVEHAPLTSEESAAVEPLVKARASLYFADSGIVDSHAFMAALESQFAEAGGTLGYRHRVNSLAKVGTEWSVRMSSPDGELSLRAGVVINAGGLGAAELSNSALGTDCFEHRYCRGRYFSLSTKYRNEFLHLVYPVPPKDGLGVHVTLDLAGEARLGPDVDWCKVSRYSEVNAEYDCDWETLASPFLAAVHRYAPGISRDDISPGLIGIRPKLFIDGKASPDFLVENREGFIHCLGIESPGLTASLAIAEAVSKFL